MVIHSVNLLIIGSDDPFEIWHKWSDPEGFRSEAPENCSYFAFWIAQNIALVAHERPFVYF